MQYLKLDNIPDENRVLTCPYCKATQNELNYKKTMWTNTNWSLFTCEACKKEFGYIQFVERIYYTAKITDNNTIEVKST